MCSVLQFIDALRVYKFAYRMLDNDKHKQEFVLINWDEFDTLRWYNEILYAPLLSHTRTNPHTAYNQPMH